MNISDEKLYRCIHCNKVLSRNDAHKRHLKIHSEEKPKLFNCNQCALSFNRNETLKRHMNIHSGEKTLKYNSVLLNNWLGTPRTFCVK